MKWVRWVCARLRPRDRWDLFRYHDGSQIRYADTLRLLMRLEGHGAPWPGLVATVLRKTDISFAERARLLGEIGDVTRQVFRLEEIHADARGRRVGLTDVECFELLTRFVNRSCDGPAGYRLAVPAAADSAGPVPPRTSIR